MSLKDYLNDFPHLSSVRIVGPLLNLSQANPSSFMDPTIYVDGGQSFKTNDFGFSVGDGDSSINSLDETLPQRKDYSDLAYVLSTIPSHFKKLKLLGFLGGRRDHELINFAEVHSYLRSLQQSEVIFDNEVIVKSQGEWSLNINGTFSIFSFEKSQLDLRGACDYPLQNQDLNPLSSHGLSNSGKGLISFKNDKPIFIFPPKDFNT